MFHLWRKRQSLALFSTRLVWGNGSESVTLELAKPGQDALAAAFAEALLDMKRGSRRKIRLSLAVSDSFAAIVALPWQDALSRATEIEAYAHAQFERAGQSLDEGWVMFAYFRRFGASGLAYAFPRDFMQRLKETALMHDVVIDSILPLSALVYARQRRSPRGTTAFILSESSRITALVTGASGLITYATEPVAGGNARSVERLLRRLQAERELQTVEGCAPEPGVEVDISSLVSRVLPSAQCMVANPVFWRA